MSNEMLWPGGPRRGHRRRWRNPPRDLYRGARLAPSLARRLSAVHSQRIGNLSVKTGAPLIFEVHNIYKRG